MKVKKGSKQEWPLHNLRKVGNATPVELLEMHQKGELNPHLQSMDQEIEYFQGKFHFSQKEINYFKDVFAFFEKQDTEQIFTHDLGLCMRAAGTMITEQEVLNLTKKVDPYNKGTIDFNDY